MGYRKSDCQFQCRWPAWGGGFKREEPTPGDERWEEYAQCMDICNEVFDGIEGKDDSAFTTAWPPEKSL